MRDWYTAQIASAPSPSCVFKTKEQTVGISGELQLSSTLSDAIGTLMGIFII